MNDGKHGVARRAMLAGMVAAAACASGARADDGWIPGGTETFKLNLGGVVTTNNANFRLDGSGGRGTDIDLESVTGLKEGVTTFFAQGTWRFAPNHRIGLTGFVVDRDRSAVIDRTITIGDTVIPVSTPLTTEAKTQFFIANYQYSFIRNADMELAATLGIYGANFKYRFSAQSPIVNIDKSTTAPLPLIGLSADFYLMPQWTATVFGEGLKLKVGDVDGSMYHVGASTEYMITRNWGAGLGWQLADLKVDVTKSGFNGRIQWRMDGWFAYLQAKF